MGKLVRGPFFLLHPVVNLTKKWKIVTLKKICTCVLTFGDTFIMDLQYHNKLKNNHGNFGLLYFMVFLQGFCGMSCGNNDV